MSKKMLVTSNQTDAVRKMANDKGVTRAEFQKGINDGRIGAFLDSLKENNLDLSVITPPEGCRIHVLRVKVNHGREWNEAINAAGPNTPDDHNVRKVGDQYPAGKGETEEDLILLNYTRGGGSWDKALAWAKEKQLKTTPPRHAFAVVEQHPKLHHQLRVNPMDVVATEECSFGGDRRACDVWWHGACRGVGLGWGCNYGNGYDWFLFCKPR